MYVFILVPQFLLDEGLLRNKMVSVTQPRRVAAISVCARVKEERLSKGFEVGYCVR